MAVNRTAGLKAPSPPSKLAGLFALFVNAATMHFSHRRGGSPGAAQDRLGGIVHGDCGLRNFFRGICCGGALARVKSVEWILVTPALKS